MSVSGAIGLAVLTFVLGVVLGRLMGRGGSQIASSGTLAIPEATARAGSFEAAQRRAMAHSSTSGPGAVMDSGPFAAIDSGPFAVEEDNPTTAADAEMPAFGTPGVFRVVLTEEGRNKINTIKQIREVTGLGLKDAKDLSERTPTLLATAASQTEADRIARHFDGIAVVRIEQG